MFMKTIVPLLLSTLLASGLSFQTKSAPTTEQTYRLLISFYSICCGINGKARGKFDVLIANYQKEQHVSLQKEIVPWGREGERDYCFALTELSATVQAALIAATQSELKDAEHVSIKENVPCCHKPREKQRQSIKRAAVKHRKGI